MRNEKVKMEANTKRTSVKTSNSVLPKLEDPKHPGMFLISRIGLFSLTLFLILISIGVYLVKTVSLDIELSLDGVIGSNEIVLYAEVSQASGIELGDKAEVTLENGAVIEAEVTEIQGNDKEKTGRFIITLMPIGQVPDSIQQYLFANVRAPLSATLFTQQSLWIFLKEEVDY